jgi:hypothetical protein
MSLVKRVRVNRQERASGPIRGLSDIQGVALPKRVPISMEEGIDLKG